MAILIVEDDPAINEMITMFLTQQEYEVLNCKDVAGAKRTVKQTQPELMIIDWMLPDASGIELLNWLRRTTEYKHIPAIMLTAKAEENDKIKGLDSGADDYMTKPVSLKELHARIKALLRRPAVFRAESEALVAGPIKLDLEQHEVTINEEPVNFTKTEFQLLKFFISNTEKVYTRDQILDAVWGATSYLGDRTVDVHILRLRKVLKRHQLDQMIKTKRGAGYLFSAKIPETARP